jgi:hypothetical protein
MRYILLAVPTLALVLAACAQPAVPSAGSEAGAGRPAPGPVVDAAPKPIAGTGDVIPAAEPATDEVQTTPGSDAEVTQYFDFRGEALATIRRARPATPLLRDAARAIVDATGKARDCGTHPEGERLFMLDLDGVPGDEALLLYTMEGCEGVENYYDRNGAVLRQVDGQWRKAADFPLGTRMLGAAHVTSITAGRLVVTPEEGSMAQAADVAITP